MPEGRLRGRRVVVTGSGGISSATVTALTAAGAAVHVVGVDAAELDELGVTPGVSTSVGDLTDDVAARGAFDEAEAALDGIDGLVAVAGGSARRFGDGPVDQLGREALEAAVRLNLLTATTALRELTTRWLRRPRPGVQAAAVLTGSTLGFFPASPLFATHGYAATKAAIVGLARSTAAHYAGDRLRVNVVAPGLTRTPMSARAQQDPEVSAYARRRQPLTEDGFVDPADVAEACAFLLGARAVTGQVLYVDGGWTVSGG